MKKILLLTVSVIMSIGLFAQKDVGVKWEKGNLQQALDRADANKKGPKLVFIDCYTTWCGPCKQMDKEVFPTKEAGKFLNKNFVNIKIDMEKGEGITLADKYEIRSFPTFLILDANGSEVGRVIGGGKLETFIPKVEKAMDPANSIYGLLIKYCESKEVEDAYTYLERLKKNNMSTKIDQFFAEFYSQLDYWFLGEEKMWQYINEAIYSKNGFFYNKIVNDMVEASKKYGKDKIELAISEATKFKLMAYIAGSLELSKEEVQQYVQTLSSINSYDNMTIIICKTASAIAANDMKKVVSQLRAHILFPEFSPSDRLFIEERILTVIKGVPKLALDRYYQQLMTLLNSSLEAAKKEEAKYDPTDVEDLAEFLDRHQSFYQEGNRQEIYGTDDFGLTKEMFSEFRGAGIQHATWDIDNLPLAGREWFLEKEYEKIFIANKILSSLPIVSGSEEDKLDLKRESLFVRAYSLWTLAQTYCLPYNEQNKGELGLPLTEGVSFEEITKRATLEETYKLIEAGLMEALKIETPLTMVNNKYNMWRASKAGVNAFAARFYLNLNQYDKALKYANIALAEHNVFMDYNTDMKYSNESSYNSVVAVGGVKIKIEYPYTHDKQSWIDMTDVLEWKEFMYLRLKCQESWWYVPSQELLALYDQTYDLRYKYHIVEHFSYNRGMTSPAYDYPGYVFFYKDEIPSGPTTAEVTLIKAEAQAHLGSYTEAMATVNTLRVKRFSTAAPSNIVMLTASNKDEAIAHVIDERRREMPFAHRWVDIRRYNNNAYQGDDIPVLTRDFYEFSNDSLNMKVKKQYNLKHDSRRWAAPLPQSALEWNNGVIKQNKY